MNEKQNIGSLFDRIAGTYDQLNHLLSLNIDRRWRKKAVAKLQPCNELLDVAIGTADLALEIVRQQKADHVSGLDLSAEMMRIGADKVRKQQLADRISFEQGSALELPYPDQHFDTVTCAYGVRNFSDLDRGLQEMQRVLQTNGQLVILEFSYPENLLVRWVYDLYFSHILPTVGRWLSKDKTAYSYLNRSVKDFIWGEEMCQNLINAGFKNAKCQTLSFGITSIYTATK